MRNSSPEIEKFKASEAKDMSNDDILNKEVAEQGDAEVYLNKLAEERSDIAEAMALIKDELSEKVEEAKAAQKFFECIFR